MLHVCRRLLRASAASKENWRLLNQVYTPSVPRICVTLWKGMETSVEQPQSIDSEASSNAMQNIKASSNTAQHIEPTLHSATEKVDESCDQESKSCDQDSKSCDQESKSCDQESKSCGDQLSSSEATEIIIARYAQEEGYEYLQRGHSTEIFKIIISNIHPKMSYSVS